MFSAIARINEWHRWAYGILGVVGIILTGIIAQPQIVPPQLQVIVGWAPFLLLIEGAIASALPKIDNQSGPKSHLHRPPTHEASGTVQGLMDGHKVVPRG